MAIAAGLGHNLALRADGSLVGWGDNDHHQIDVPAGSHFTAIAAGMDHSLALTPVPEPSTLAGLLSMGGAFVLAQLWRRRRGVD